MATSKKTRRGGKIGSGVGNIPAIIRERVDRVREMSKNGAYGELQGDIKVTKDENGNYNLSFVSVRNYNKIESATIGVGDTPARKETTYTTYVMNKEGKRINTIRKTETEYKTKKAEKTSSDDWSGINANRGTSRTAKRRMKSASNWADMQVLKRK